MNRAWLRILPALLVAALPASAQYTRPGELGEPRPRLREQIVEADRSARWQAGPVRLEPRLEISDLGYVSNIFFSSEQEALSDFKARGTAGLRGFFNLGPKVLVSPFADLNYSWWQEQTELRSFNESFGVQLFGDLNRLQLQLQAARLAIQQNLSSELEVPVDRQNDRIELAVDVDFWGPLRLFGEAGENRLRYSGKAAEDEIEGLDLSTLEADEELLQAGLGYEVGERLIIAVGVERTETLFLNDPGGRSNSGSGPLARIDFRGSRLRLEIEGARRDLKFDGRPAGEVRRQTEGRGRLASELGERTSAALYGGVRLQASAVDRSGIFESRRNGILLRHRPGRRSEIGIFYELGEDEFASAGSDRVTRVDDLRSYGVNLRLQWSERVGIEIGYLDVQRDSSIPEFDSDLRSLTSRLSIGADLLP